MLAASSDDGAPLRTGLLLLVDQTSWREWAIWEEEEDEEADLNRLY